MLSMRARLEDNSPPLGEQAPCHTATLSAPCNPDAMRVTNYQMIADKVLDESQRSGRDAEVVAIELAKQRIADAKGRMGR